MQPKLPFCRTFLALVALLVAGCNIHHTINPVDVTLNLRVESEEDELNRIPATPVGPREDL